MTISANNITRYVLARTEIKNDTATNKIESGMVEICPEMDQIDPEKNENISIRNPGHKSDPEFLSRV